jgi:hypothetical protein
MYAHATMQFVSTFPTPGPSPEGEGRSQPQLTANFITLIASELDTVPPTRFVA